MVGVMLVVTVNGAALSMRCAECSDRVRGWVVPLGNAEALAAAVTGAVDHGALTHRITPESGENRPEIAENRAESIDSGR